MSKRYRLLTVFAAVALIGCRPAPPPPAPGNSATRLSRTPYVMSMVDPLGGNGDPGATGFSTVEKISNWEFIWKGSQQIYAAKTIKIFAVRRMTNAVVIQRDDERLLVIDPSIRVDCIRDIYSYYGTAVGWKQIEGTDQVDFEFSLPKSDFNWIRRTPIPKDNWDNWFIPMK